MTAGSKGTALSFVHLSGQTPAGEAGAPGAQEAKAGRRAGEGEWSLPSVSCRMWDICFFIPIANNDSQTVVCLCLGQCHQRKSEGGQQPGERYHQVPG